VEGSGHGLTWGAVLAFTWEDDSESQSQGWDLNNGSPEYKPGFLAISLRYSVCCWRIEAFIFNLLFLFYEEKMAVLMASSCTPVPLRNPVVLILYYD
jgi:hypothetical protein